MNCTCACEGAHPIATRTTADGRALWLWSTGALTAQGGAALPGVPVARPSTPDARAVALDAGRLALGEACLWDADDLPALYTAARRVAARGGAPGDLRAALDSVAAPCVPIRWEEPTAGLRVGHLPRMGWPDLVVVRERGVYDVRVIVGNGLGGFAGVPTGREFRAARDLHRWLHDNRAVGPRRGAQVPA